MLVVFCLRASPPRAAAHRECAARERRLADRACVGPARARARARAGGETTLTRSEALLWAQLRGRKLGPRVRRQHVLHPFVVDFFVCVHRLAIEIDGPLHRFQREHDRARDAQLACIHRVRVLRIDAELVEQDVLAAVAIVRAAL